MVAPLVDTVESLTDRIRSIDKVLEDLADDGCPESEVVRWVPGVGVPCGLAFVLTLDERDRLEHRRDVPACLGLAPKRDQSGEVDRLLGISRTGDTFMRRLWVQAAQCTRGPLAPDSDLRRWGQSLAERGGPRAWRRAVVAVARKPAVILRRPWVTGEEYGPCERPHEHQPPLLRSCSSARRVPGLLRGAAGQPVGSPAALRAPPTSSQASAQPGWPAGTEGNLLACVQPFHDALLGEPPRPPLNHEACSASTRVHLPGSATAANAQGPRHRCHPSPLPR